MRRRILLLATGALPALVAACGGTGASGSLATVNPAGAVTALNATMAAHTAAVHLDTMSGGSGKVPHDQSASGVWDFATNSGHLDAAVSAGGRTAYQSFIQTGGTLYYGAGSYAPVQSQWFSLPAGSQAAGFGIGSTRYLDPNTALSALQKMTTVQSTGPGEYQGSVPLGTFGPTLVPAQASLPRLVKLYVTGGRVTKEVFSGPVVSAPNGSYNETVTITFANFGVPVNVSPPPASLTSPGGAQ